MLKPRCLPPIPSHRRPAGGPALPGGDRPVSLVDARGGAVGSEEVACVLDAAGRLSHCVWLRLDAGDRETGTFAHAIAQSAERSFPGTGAELAGGLTRRPDGRLAPADLARALALHLPGEAVVVIEDEHGVVNTRPFMRFGSAWSTSAAASPPVVLVVHGRAGRQLRAFAPTTLPADRRRGRDPLATDGDRAVGAGQRPAAGGGEPALSAHLVDRLARIAAGRSALVDDVTDAATAERCEVVAAVVATARGPRDLLAGLSRRLLAEADPEVVDALTVASRLGYWHPDLGSADATALRPWLLPLQDDWHWLRPYWARPLRRSLRGLPQRARGQPATSPRPVVDAGRSRGASSPAGRTRVAVRMLGAFELDVDGNTVTNWNGQVGPSVLKYLLAQPKRACPRDVLLDVFWPSVAPDLARNRLHVALSGVRRTLAAATDTPLVEFRDSAYHVGSCADVDLDVDSFERLVESGRREELEGRARRAVDCYREAVDLYLGDFLADLPYEEWTTLPREGLRITYLDLLDRLARLLLAGDRYADCVDVAGRILRQDACREDAHRLLMRCYAHEGRHHQALRQYDVCRRSLREALDVDPSPATRDLYLTLRAAAGRDGIDRRRPA